MSDGEINSLLFRGVIANLHNLQSGDGNRLNTDSGIDDLQFSIAYQQRPVERFPHNYERDKFLHHRDRFILLHYGRRSFIVVRSQDREVMTIYRKPFQLAFPNDHERVVSILEKLIHKFYDDVSVEDMSTVQIVDTSTSNSGSNNHRVQHEI